jgi:hypothetical protein
MGKKYLFHMIFFKNEMNFSFGQISMPCFIFNLKLSIWAVLGRIALQNKKKFETKFHSHHVRYDIIALSVRYHKNILRS